MSNRRCMTIALGLLVAFSAGQASATIVDFEDVAVASGTYTTGGDVTSNGYLFNTTTNHSHLSNNANFTTPTVDNGGTYMVIDDWLGSNPTWMLESATGATFDLATIEFAEWAQPDRIANNVVVTGFFTAGGSISQTVVLDQVWDGAGGVADFQLEIFNWSGLSQVSFEGFGSGTGEDYYAIDNLNLVVAAAVGAPIPEPATLSLLGLGLVGIVARRRARGRSVL